MQKELRQVERIALSAQPKGKLRLYTDGKSQAVQFVLNISPEGISVQLGNSVAVASEVEFQYKHQALDIRVNGTVVWSRESKDQAPDGSTGSLYDVGVNLISPHLLFSLMQSEYQF